MGGILATATKTAIRLDEVAEENILLRRQVEVLAKEFKTHGRCVECQARSLCLHSAVGITCGDAIKQWSLEQAKAGGGGANAAHHTGAVAPSVQALVGNSGGEQ
jgi:hypothetical protein